MAGRELQLENRLRDAILRGDVKAIGNLVDTLRFRFGATYEQCFTLATRVSSVTKYEWDDLLYGADQLEEWDRVEKENQDQEHEWS